MKRLRPWRLARHGLMAALYCCTAWQPLAHARDGEEPDAVAAANAAESLEPELRFSGIGGELRDNVLAHLVLAGETCSAPTWRIRERFKRADKQIREALAAFGHYQPEIEAALSLDPPCWGADFTIQPGARVTMDSVEVVVTGEAADDPVIKALLEDLPLKRGDPLRHDRYEDTKTRLATVALERGYLAAKIEESTLDVQPSASIAEARIRLRSGVRHRFGPVHIHTQTLDADYVDRFVPFREGEPYHAKQLAELHKALADSGYFETVEVRPRLSEIEDASVAVDVRLTARKRRRYGFGVGASTDAGPRARVDYMDRRITATGHRLEAKALASPVQAEIGASYRIPLGDPRSDWLSFEANLSREKTDSTDLLGGHLRIKNTKTRGRWRESLFLELSRENFEVDEETFTSTLLTPGLAYSRAESDDPIFPRNGYSAFAETRGGLRGVFSDTSLARLQVGGKWIGGAPWGGRVLLRGELGALWADDFEVLPSSLRFFAGGDRSVRGYGFKELGPKGRTGDAIGGRYLSVLSLEYEHPIVKDWSAAVFIDSGNAFDKFSDGLKSGVGAGLRWRSPIGPVRLDFAIPVDEADSRFRVHVSIGPDL